MNEENFDTLRRLLKLKRHEVPRRDISTASPARSLPASGRVKPGDARTAEHVFGTSWWSNFFQLFELKPAFAGAFASALCLLLIFGVVYADRPESGPQPFLPNTGSSMASFASVTPSVMPSATYAADGMASNSPAASLQPVASLFGSENPLVQPVSFSPAGN